MPNRCDREWSFEDKLSSRRVCSRICDKSELAKRMKVSKPYITKVLRQDVNFSFRTAAKLAHALEMDFFPELREKEE